MLATLTPRQQTILAGLLQERPQPELAHEIGVSAATVSAELEAIRQGILTASPEQEDQPDMLQAAGILLGITP